MDKVYTPASFSQHYEEWRKEPAGAFGDVFKVCLYNILIQLPTHLKKDGLSGIYLSVGCFEIITI